MFKLKFDITIQGLDQIEADQLMEDFLITWPDKTTTMRRHGNEGPPAYHSYQDNKPMHEDRQFNKVCTTCACWPCDCNYESDEKTPLLDEELPLRDVAKHFVENEMIRKAIVKLREMIV